MTFHPSRSAHSSIASAVRVSSSDPVQKELVELRARLAELEAQIATPQPEPTYEIRRKFSPTQDDKSYTKIWCVRCADLHTGEGPSPSILCTSQENYHHKTFFGYFCPKCCSEIGWIPDHNGKSRPDYVPSSVFDQRWLPPHVSLQTQDEYGRVLNQITRDDPAWQEFYPDDYYGRGREDDDEDDDDMPDPDPATVYGGEDPRDRGIASRIVNKIGSVLGTAPRIRFA